MTWFKVDDGFYDHPKIQSLPLTARGLWVTAGSYAARHLTDGFVPVAMLKVFGARSRDAQALVDAGLWRARLQPETSHTPAKLQPNSSHSTTPQRASQKPEAGRVVGYDFNDWQDWQPTKAQVRADQEAARDRQRAWRERKRNGVTNASRHGVTNGAPTRPDPTLSLPTLSQASGPADMAGPNANGEREESPQGQTTTRQLAASLLGIDHDDPKLDALPAVLKSYQVRAPGAWLRAAALKGDLESLLGTPPETDPWAHLPKNPEPPPPGVPRPAHLRPPERTAR